MHVQVVLLFVHVRTTCEWCFYLYKLCVVICVCLSGGIIHACKWCFYICRLCVVICVCLSGGIIHTC